MSEREEDTGTDGAPGLPPAVGIAPEQESEATINCTREDAPHPLLEAAIEQGVLQAALAAAAPGSSAALEEVTGVRITPRSSRRGPAILSQLVDIAGKGHGIDERLRHAEQHAEPLTVNPGDQPCIVELRHQVAFDCAQFLEERGRAMVYDFCPELAPCMVMRSTEVIPMVQSLLENGTPHSLYDTTLPDTGVEVRLVVVEQKDSTGRLYNFRDPFSQVYSVVRDLYSCRAVIVRRDRCFHCGNAREIAPCECKLWFTCKDCPVTHKDCNSSTWAEVQVQECVPGNMDAPLPASAVLAIDTAVHPRAADMIQ